MSDEPIRAGSVCDPNAVWPGREWINGKWRTPGRVVPEPEDEHGPKQPRRGGLRGGPGDNGPPPTEW